MASRTGLRKIFDEMTLLRGVSNELPRVARALAFAPHPDDEVFGCGGAAALLARADAQVQAVIVTDGQAGLASASADVAVRCAESRRAAGVLGCRPPIFWHLPDRGLQVAPLVARIAQVIEDERAELVFLPAPLEIHPDHQAVALAGLAALRLLATPPLAFFYEVGQPLAEPTHVIPIDAAWPAKQQAMLCFGSQLEQLPYDQRIAGLNRYRAYHLGPGAAAAEAFVVWTGADADALARLFAPQLRVRRLLADNRRLVHRNTALVTQLAELAKSNAALIEHNAALSEHNAALQADCAAYRRSTSWRITAPLRALGDFLRSLARDRNRQDAA